MKKHLTDGNIKTILMTADTIGGVWTYALDLAACLAEKGITVHLATMGNYLNPQQQEQVSSLENVQVHQSNFKLEWMENPWHEVEQAGNWLMELQEEIKPDLVHLNNYCHGHLDWKVPVVIVCHSCIYTWWQAVKGENPPDYYADYYQKVKEGLEAADLVVAPTQAMLHSICEIYGGLKNTLSIPNGTADTVNPAPKENFIFCMGRLWDEAKNVKVLNDIAPQVSWPIVVAGETRLHHQKLPDNQIQNLNMVGYLNRTLAIEALKAAAIYVHPAKYEPFGLSVLEAAKAGCVLVLADIPPLRENWQDVAFFADPEDPREFQLILNMFIEDTSLQQEYARRAEARASYFMSEKTAENYHHAYQELVSV